MMELPEAPPLVLLDACCAINLLATGIVEEILAANSADFAVAEIVLEEEVLHVQEEGEEGADEGAGDEVTLQPLVDQGLLTVITPESEEELATFVGLAFELDDGEAQTGALAIHRGGEVATDDRKAIRVLEGWSPPVAIRRTSQVIQAWAEAEGVDAGRLAKVLQRVERNASFGPPGNDPEREWWVGAAKGEGE